VRTADLCRFDVFATGDCLATYGSLIGANLNAGKTSFLDALFSAIGAGRKILGQDDVHLATGEAFPPKDRQVIIDVRIRPIDNHGKVAEKFPEGSFWTALWGTGIAPDEVDFTESMSFRTTLAWSLAKGDYGVERKFLKGMAALQRLAGNADAG
jgi:putative ATP-dependent endonuclease of OLD family